MLSIKATVYADSNDKYGSIFKTTKKKKKEMGLLSELKYSVEYLQVLGTRVGHLPIIELKCSVPLA